jgi:hypothetical protein
MSKRIDLAVPFEEKEEAKKFYVEWDDERKVWWTTEAHMCEGLERWLPYTPTSQELFESLAPLYSTEVERQKVKLYSQSCEYSEWMLLMLPEGRWGAFWQDDIITRRASIVVAGDYENGCRFVGSSLTKFWRTCMIIGYIIRLRPSSTKHLLLQIQAASLTIAGRTIEFEVPWVFGHLMKHLSEGAENPILRDDFGFGLYKYLEVNTLDIFKRPLDSQLEKAAEISQALRIPITAQMLQDRKSCQDFIDKHSCDLTVFKNIRKTCDRKTWAMTKLVSKYVKWLSARTMLEQEIPWEVIAEQHGVKTKATIEKYAAQADQAERDNPELLECPVHKELIKIGLNGESVECAMRRSVDAEAWYEFSMERQARQLLRERRDQGT